MHISGLLMMISLESYGSALLFLAASFLICTVCFGNNSAPGKKRRSNFVVALVIIGFIGALKVFYDSSLFSVNNYSVLQVPRHCSTLDIRKAYKRLSKEHHPDKSVDPESLVFYQKVKNAYDVLMDETARDVYNRFGDVDMSAKVIPDPRKDELQLIADIALVYLFWIVLVFVATSPVSSQSCRTWIAIIGVICMVVESTLKLTDTTVPESYLPQYLTEHELVCYIHCTFPVVVALLKCVSESLYVDVNTTTIAVLEETIKAQKVRVIYTETIIWFICTLGDGFVAG